MNKKRLKEEDMHVQLIDPKEERIRLANLQKWEIKNKYLRGWSQDHNSQFGDIQSDQVFPLNYCNNKFNTLNMDYDEDLYSTR